MVVLSSMRRKAGGDRCRRDRPQVVHAPRAALACVGSTPAFPDLGPRAKDDRDVECRRLDLVGPARPIHTTASSLSIDEVIGVRRLLGDAVDWSARTSRSWRATVRMLDGLADHMEGRSLQRCVVTVTDKALGGRRVEEVPQGRAVGHPGLAFNPFAAETVWRGKRLYPSHDKASRGLRAAVGNVRAGYLSLSGTRGG